MRRAAGAMPAPAAAAVPVSVGARLKLLACADVRGWPRLVVGRQTIGPGELAWRQAVTLATADELAALEAALLGPSALQEAR